MLIFLLGANRLIFLLGANRPGAKRLRGRNDQGRNDLGRNAAGAKRLGGELDLGRNDPDSITAFYMRAALGFDSLVCCIHYVFHYFPHNYRSDIHDNSFAKRKCSLKKSNCV